MQEGIQPEASGSSAGGPQGGAAGGKDATQEALEKFAPHVPRHRDEYEIEFSRIVAFSDGVFAIAITLLVLTIEVPKGVSDLPGALADQEGDFFAYALSFAVIGKLWLVHHRFFSGVERFNNRLMGLNLLYLGSIVLIPFSSEVLGEYADQPAGVIVYAADMAAVGIVGSLMTIYAYRAKLMREAVQPLEHVYARYAVFIMPGIFLVSIPIAFLSTQVATLSWLLLFLIGRRMYGR